MCEACVDNPRWRADLEDAQRQLTPEQVVWDGHWQRWLAIARRAKRSFADAISIAWTRTEAQHGPRPETQPKETEQ